MANLPVRNLGGAGIVTDIHPYDLQPNAISAGVNVRFENGKISRAPVFRRVYEFTDLGEEDGDFTDITPAYMFSIPPVSSGVEDLIVVKNDYSQIVSVNGDTVTDVTHTGAVSNDSLQPFSSCFLGNVAYLNRRSFVPLKKDQSDSTFEALPNWDSNDRASVIRPYKDYLIALNVSKSSTEYPTMVKWSNEAQYGAVPTSWDATDPTVNTGENILNEAKTAIVDGLSLGDNFVIYCENEVWLMRFTNSSDVFDFRKSFADVGIINANCVTEVDGVHYVFDTNDIYVHDGLTKPQSIAHGKTREFIFDGLIEDLSYLCFVTHNPQLTEVRFCYPSADRLVGFRDASTGCNRAAVYNYRRGTWTFEDLPNVTAATFATLTSGLTWEASDPTTWTEMGGSWLGSTEDDARHLLYASRLNTDAGLTASRILGQDLLTGGRLTKPIEDEALKEAFVERIGIDLDEMNVALTSYKCIQAIYPQMSLSEGATVEFQLGANDDVGASPTWESRVSFDPATEIKVDGRPAGHYLAWRLYHSGSADFSLSGFDAKVTVRGQRG